MRTEHSVTYEIAGGNREITRVVFTAGRRILGTETTRERVWRGYQGWYETSMVTDTRQFMTAREASDWIDEMFREWEIAGVRARGGTRLVILE